VPFVSQIRSLRDRFVRWERQLSPLQISVIYALLAGLWVLISDEIVSPLVTDAALRVRIEIIKDVLFVVVSAALLFGLISRLMQKVRRSESQLAHTDRLASMGTMAASVAHEVNNPLTTIKVLIHTIRDKTPADDPNRKDFDIVLDEIDKIRALILRFLQFARPGEPELSDIDLEDVSRRVVKLVRPQAATRGIEISEAYTERTGPLRADSTQLGQVLLNILLNAVEATPNGGHIAVAAAAADRMVELRVHNSGEPIDTDLCKRIFEPFFSTKAQGTGLGLAIASAIVEKHQGRIWAEPGEDGGTALRVRLPQFLGDDDASRAGR